MDMIAPSLPVGHRHLWTPERALARGYWLALDNLGYEYTVGHGNFKQGSSEVSVATAPDGNRRIWRKEEGGAWAEATPSTCRTRWLERCPPRLRASDAWMLPGGQRAAGNLRIKQAVDSWVADPQRGEKALCLHGPPGTGKSQTAVWVGLLIADLGIDGEWLHAPTGAQAMRASYSGDRDAYAAQRDRWLRAPFLVVDDLGAETQGKDVAELVYQLADARYNACLSTVWTSNVAPMLLSQSGFDPRTASRIASGYSVECNGKDRRLS